MTIYTSEDHREATVYVKHGVTYVPHYFKPGIWVGPGYGRHNDMEYTETMMEAAGAEAEQLMLWPRASVRAKEVTA